MSTKENICERGKLYAGSEREKKLLMTRRCNRGIRNDRSRKKSQRWDDLDADGVKEGVVSRDKVKHIEKSDQS